MKKRSKKKRGTKEKNSTMLSCRNETHLVYILYPRLVQGTIFNPLGYPSLVLCRWTETSTYSNISSYGVRITRCRHFSLPPFSFNSRWKRRKKFLLLVPHACICPFIYTHSCYDSHICMYTTLDQHKNEGSGSNPRSLLGLSRNRRSTRSHRHPDSSSPLFYHTNPPTHLQHSILNEMTTRV